ncbi:hypothetical protein F2Q69_00056492 [Brassica cretica]|uniref:Uncharacterized protein n=1 Tax=Brassica cretica TaxID=69181 RepID=A0A8S9MQL7_BRACR|nr:hypothetical protein F2Q69_00056492 [Brassica cretica]
MFRVENEGDGTLFLCFVRVCGSLEEKNKERPIRLFTSKWAVDTFYGTGGNCSDDVGGTAERIEANYVVVGAII